MRNMAVLASITESRSFHDMRSLLLKIPFLQENMEGLAVKGFGLDVPRFHLVPLEIYTALPSIQSLALRGGLVYMPAVFFVSMRRFNHLTRLVLHQTIFLSVHDLRRMLESLRHLAILTLFLPDWLPDNPPRPPYSGPRPARSCISLEMLEIDAEAAWITDTRSIDFLDWLSTSGAISEIHDLRLRGLMLIDDDIMAAVSRMLYAVQKSSKLSNVNIIFGPEMDLTPREFLPPESFVETYHDVPPVHDSLASFPRLKHLWLTCPYDAASLSELTDCLSLALSRPKETMHSHLYLQFDKYPHHGEPPAECWEKLDSALQRDGLQTVNVDCRVQQCDPGEPVVWGDLYSYERSYTWIAQARERFPKVRIDGHLWAKGSRKGWHHIQCE